MQWLRAAIDPTAKVLSPDLCDSYYGNSVGPWVAAYKNAGGGFGDAIAWHAYWGTHGKSLWSTADMMLAVGGTKPIWVTEDGGFGVNPGRGINDSASVQADKVFWMIDTLAAQPRVARVYYYEVGSSPDWDTALLTPTGSRRPSWFLWCAASHGGNSPDCAP